MSAIIIYLRHYFRFRRHYHFRRAIIISLMPFDYFIDAIITLSMTLFTRAAAMLPCHYYYFAIIFDDADIAYADADYFLLRHIIIITPCRRHYYYFTFTMILLLLRCRHYYAAIIFDIFAPLLLLIFSFTYFHTLLPHTTLLLLRRHFR